MKLIIHIFSFLILFLICPIVSAQEIQWVWVGDANNESDDTGFGSVNYEYLISMYEITNEEYCEFLNAVAKDDTYGLYNPEMSSSRFGGVERFGEKGDYYYSVKPEKEKHPINFVSWYDCLRFANWLHNGMPDGRQDVTTTEDGAYTFDGPDIVGPRNKDAVFFLPSENEWYKAAYYKGDSLNAGYWWYTTQNDIQPVIEKPPGGINSAYAGFMPAGGLTNVGAYKSSFSAYGTYDQNGNISEWTESRFNNAQWCIRGGSFDVSLRTMKASVRERNSVLHPESWNFGFRIAASPEDIDI